MKWIPKGQLCLWWNYRWKCPAYLVFHCIILSFLQVSCQDLSLRLVLFFQDTKGVFLMLTSQSQVSLSPSLGQYWQHSIQEFLHSVSALHCRGPLQWHIFYSCNHLAIWRFGFINLEVELKMHDLFEAGIFVHKDSDGNVSMALTMVNSSFLVVQWFWSALDKYLLQ